MAKITDAFRERHRCKKCREVRALWDLDYGRWCDECVTEAGGILAAGTIVRNEWNEKTRLAQEEARQQREQLEQKLIDQKKQELKKAKPLKYEIDF